MYFLEKKRRNGTPFTAWAVTRSGLRAVLRLAQVGMLVLGGVTSTWAEKPLDLEPPVVQMENLQPGQIVSGVFTVQIAASDSQGVASVSLTRDGGFLDTDFDPPFHIPWDTRKESDGPHTLVARARDVNANIGVSQIITVTVDNTPPQVHMKEPQPETVVLGTIRLVAEATDNVGLPTVRFLVDGSEVATVSSPPYTAEWNTKTVSNTFHFLQAMAIDLAGNQQTSAARKITVTNTNHPPVLAPLDPITLKEGETLSFTLQAHDPDGSRDTLTFRATDLPLWARLDPKTGKVEGTPDHKVASVKHPKAFAFISFEVCDPEPRCATRDLRLTILDVNLPPKLINPTGDIEVREGIPVEFTISDFTDLDDTPVKYSVRGLPRWLRFIQKTRTIKGVPPFDTITQLEPSQRHRISVKVTDPGKLSDSNTFTITLVDADLPPSFKGLVGRSANEEEAFFMPVHATDPDETDQLKIKLLSFPDGATFIDHGNRTGTFRWTPQANQSGTYYLIFVVSDGMLVVQKTIVLKVRETILTIAGTLISNIGKPFPGVHLSLTLGGDEVRTAISDEEGRFLMTGLRRGKYILRPAYDPSAAIVLGDRTRFRKTIFIPRTRSIKLESEDLKQLDFIVRQPIR